MIYAGRRGFKDDVTEIAARVRTCLVQFTGLRLAHGRFGPRLRFRLQLVPDQNGWI